MSVVALVRNINKDGAKITVLYFEEDITKTKGTNLKKCTGFDSQLICWV